MFDIEKGSVESTHKVPTSHYHTKHCHAVVAPLGGLTHRFDIEKGSVDIRRADHFSRGGSRKDAYADASESRTVQYRQHDADTAALSTEIHVL